MPITEGSAYVDKKSSSTSKCPEVVISGISGMYPEARSVKELAEILYNKVNPIKLQEGSSISHPELSQFRGTAPDVSRFDAQFFKVNYRTAKTLDAMSRKVLEHTYHALYDAGVSLHQLNGKKVGVYIGSSFSETEKTGTYANNSKGGAALIGCNKSMFSARISYWLNLKGPTVSLDVACCGSVTALEQAYYAIKRGECEAAIVGGAHLCGSPQSLLHYGRIMKMSKNGQNKSFDEHASGCVKSEAVNVMFLQRAEDALRNYATIVNVKCVFSSLLEDEKRIKYDFSRDPDKVAKFIKEFYEEAKVSPNLVEYVEGFGSGVPESDKSELESLEKVYCDNRSEPIMVGSVTSNIGYTESGSSLSAITKVLLGYETGVLAGNLHCEHPRQDVRAIREGRMRILTVHSPLRGAYSAVNCMSITGLNGHILLRGNCKPKNSNHYKSSIPYLVNLSGRQENSIQHIFENLKSHLIDPEELALLHNCHSNNIPGHLARGFIILDLDEKQNTISLCELVDYYDEVKRPLWFVYSGMGSQWAGMGRDLMRIPTFAAAIERCHVALKPKGIDVVHIITNNDASTFDNILNSFVGIAAVQIGLTDVLKELEIVPENIIGHSVGELGCAYADDCLTAEQMILAAYYRGLVSLETPFIRGSMAAIGLGYKQIKNMCPAEIEVACHNGSESSTISGPADVMKSFVAELTAKNIFAKEVPCSNIAYHSRYIAKAGPKLLEYLKEVIKTPKLRSERWVSTSVPQDKWSETASKYASAEYLTNNLLNPVLFEETATLIPPNAVLVEIAPHGLLQAILKRSLHPDCKNIALTKRGNTDNVTLVLKALGRLYMEGIVSKVQNLYPKVEFPVSTGTPMLSHLVKWAYDEIWPVPNYISANSRTAAACEYIASIHDEEYKYIQGHVIRGKTIYPFAASLVSVWDTLAMALNRTKKSISVEFRDVYLHSQPILHEQRSLKLKITIQKATGQFEVLEGNLLLITGIILKLNKNISNHMVRLDNLSTEKDYYDTKDVYALFSQRDYSYSGDFQSIRRANSSLTKAIVEWHGNWVTFIDSLLQLNMLKQNHDGVSQPSFISKILINVTQQALTAGNTTSIEAYVSDIYDTTYSGGTLMQYIRYHEIPAMIDEQICLKALSTETQIDPQIASYGTERVRTKEVALQSKHTAGLDTIHWVNVPEPAGLGIKVKVQYSGLYFADVLKTLGNIPLKSKDGFKDSYGIDFSGVTVSGDRVMGISKTGACRSHVIVPPELLWPVPESWNLEDAATVPFAYACAFYCLFIKAELRPGMSILVNDGDSALGQAVIYTALAYNCQVFTTVSENKNKKILRKLYPELEDKQFGTSTDDNFGDFVMNETKGQGCEIVISSVRGALKNVSLKCCALNGVTLDTVQIPYKENFQYGMYNLTKERSYIALDFTSILEDFSEMKILQQLLSEGITRGYVRPLSRVTYTAAQAVRAFRLLSNAHYSGKVLLKFDDTPPSISSLLCDKDTCHVLLCDQEMLGIQLAKKLVLRGAKHLLLSFTHLSGTLQHYIRLWQSMGVQVKTTANVFANCNDAAVVLANAERMGPIEGIYIIATDPDYDKNDKFSALLTEIDLLIRNICPSPKYFAVVTTDGLGWSKCIERAKNELNGRYINFVNLGKIFNLNTASCRQIIDEMEHAIVLKRTLLVAERQEINQISLVQKVFDLAGLNVPEGLKDTSSLADLGVGGEILELIRLLFLHEYNASLEPEKIPFLKINDIRQMEDAIKESSFKQMHFLEKFFSYIETDELLASTLLVPVPTLGDNCIVRSDDEFQTAEDKSYIYIMPGLEGCHERFRTMCERLKISTIVLQPDIDKFNGSFYQTATMNIKVVLERSQSQNYFYLVGYESGVLTALEMAAMLESHGKIGTVYCIGAAPEEFKVILDHELREYKTEADLQNAIIRHVVKLLNVVDTSELDVILNKSTTWPMKVDNSVRFLFGKVSHTSQYTQALIESFYTRIKQVQAYTPLRAPLRSRIVHLRPSDVGSSSQALQAYSQQPIATHDLVAPLSQAAQDARCAAIINQYLEPELLKAFENKNLCETYLLNDEAFIALENEE